jgi:signal transduction histidine kinase
MCMAGCNSSLSTLHNTPPLANHAGFAIHGTRLRHKAARALWGVHPIDGWKQAADTDCGLAARRRGIKHPGESRLDSTYKVKRKMIALSRRYMTALQKHLQQGPRAIPPCGTARALGRQAAALDLETLDVARIHEGALATLEASSSSDGVIKRAELFFTETITPIEETHRAALKANVRLSQLTKTLDRRTVDLTAANRSLKQGIVQRKLVEQALKKSGEHSRKLLKESRRLQKHLQRLTHQILSAQEAKRKRISHDLHDEIAQTLLGINVRLLTLKKEAAINAGGLKKEIASTQRLVDKSVKSIKRFAREFGIHHRTQSST